MLTWRHSRIVSGTGTILNTLHKFCQAARSFPSVPKRSLNSCTSASLNPSRTAPLSGSLTIILFRRLKFFCEDCLALNEKDSNWAKNTASGVSSTGGGVGVRLALALSRFLRYEYLLFRSSSERIYQSLQRALWTEIGL